MPNARSLRQPGYLFVLSSAGAVVIILFLLVYKINSEKTLNNQLNNMLDATIQEKERLQADLSRVQQQMEEKERQLAGLSNVAAIRGSLESAQAMIKQLNTDLEKANSERIAASNDKFGLANKLDNSTKELLRTMDDLKRTQDALQKSQGGGATKELQARGQELASLKDQLGKLQSANKDLTDSNAVLQKKITELRSVVEKSDVRDLSPNVKELQAASSAMQENLAEKEARIRDLETELGRVSATGKKVAYDSGQQGKVKELMQLNDDLKGRLADLELELRKAKSGAPSGISKDLYESAKDQVNRVSDLLVKKEVEIDNARKEALEAKEKLFTLQAKLSSLENNMSQNKDAGEKAKDLENQLLSAQSKLNDLQESASQKAELAESLQKNVSFLTDQLSKKDADLRLAEARYSKVDGAAKEDVEKQKTRYDEINMLYSSLKTQVTQFSDALNLKEAELDQRRKENSAFREEIAALRSRSDSLEKELADAKDRQRKTLDDLVAAVKLNTVLQERIMGISPQGSRGGSAASGGAQQKADELKRKIEVILEPQNKTP
jgi:chromosome segregation ATPase